MSFVTTITSKGTITISAPIRRALGLKPGQKVRLSVNERNKVEIDPGTSIEEFEAIRDEILSKYPRRKPLTGKALKDAIARAWVEDHR